MRDIHRCELLSGAQLPFADFCSRRTMLLLRHSCRPPPSLLYGSVRAKSGASPSSKRYIRRLQRDPFGRHRNAGVDNPVYVARSAYKLLRLDKEHRLFSKTTDEAARLCVIDLGAAPGGWTQVALQALALRGPTEPHTDTLIACDLLPLSASAVSNVPPSVAFHFVQGDFTTLPVQANVQSLIESARPTRMLVLSDMMSAVSGIAVRDAQASFDICHAAMRFAEKFMPGIPGSSLVMKHMQGHATDELRWHLVQRWSSVKWSKPVASRSESREGYFIVRKPK